MESQKKWQRVQYMPGTGIGPDGARVTGGREHTALARRAAREGMVLLKNEGGILPFAPGTRLAVFGKAQADYVKGGGGSGDTTVAYVRSLLDGLDEKQREGRISLYAPLSEFYKADVASQYASGKAPGMTDEPALPDALLTEARSFTDTAIISICRFSGESYDRTGEPFDGDFYLSHGESELVARVRGAFPRIVVVLNTGGMMDTAWFRNDDGIGGALLCWQGGMEGGMAAADLLLGDDCPSGRLTDTFAVDFAAYPSSATFGESEDYVDYIDDIYVGYRYFETVPGAADKVNYPFGYGLSYTTFCLSDLACRAVGDDFTATVTVENTGDVAGREVVQLYAHCPQGRLGKPKYVLAAFAKTRKLLPGEQETLTMHFTAYDFASYDDVGKVHASAYVLEKGEYRFYAGGNVRDVHDLGMSWQVQEDRVIRQLTAKCVPARLDKRMRADGSFEPLPVREMPPVKPWDASILPFDGQIPVEDHWPRTWCGWGEPDTPQLMDVYTGKMTLDAFMDLLTDEQLVHLLGGQPNRGPANTFGFGNLLLMGIPNVMTADGPAGLRIQPACGVTTTAFPCATLLACTWDTELLYQVGKAGAEEVRENGIGVWLTPAINIHRSPLCGRNFEYYSEDPLVAGKLSAALVRGIQSEGVAASVKHFACNNKETNRRDSDSRLSERALREIYLKAFEINVREADPWTIMSSYNLINGVRASENHDLLTDILRDEWHFDGMVTTDWYTHAEQYTEIEAGNDVKMGCGMPEHTLRMLREGKLDPAALRLSVTRLLRMLLKLA